MGSSTTYLTFAQTVPGLEALLVRELADLGYSFKPTTGGAEGRVTLDQLYALCLRSRIAENVRIRLKAFVAKDFRALTEGLKKLPFHAYLPKGQPLAVRVTCHKSRLWHSGAVEERVRLVLTESGFTFSDELEDPFTVYVRVTDDEVVVSVDASGPRLHRRGYRKFVEKASLRETLAAALLRIALAELPPERRAQPLVLWDPFCGAGTILLEALHAASGRPAGEKRTFAFEDWPSFRAEEFASLRTTAVERPFADLRVVGSDHTEKAIRTARMNFEAAGFQGELLHEDFARAARSVPDGAFVVTNPPYGKRIKDEVGPRLVDLLERRRDLRPAVILTGGALDAAFEDYRTLFTTENGGLKVSARVSPTASGTT